jgi:GGDEF domain-containing protein
MKVHEEIARCLRTRRHLSVALLTAGAADAGRRAGLALGPDALQSIAEDLARHIRCCDLVAASGAAEVMRMFSEATCERTSVILDRLRAATATLPRVPPGGSSPLSGLATWPADGNDSTALLETVRHRLSATYT